MFCVLSRQQDGTIPILGISLSNLAKNCTSVAPSIQTKHSALCNFSSFLKIVDVEDSAARYHIRSVVLVI